MKIKMKELKKVFVGLLKEMYEEENEKEGMELKGPNETRDVQLKAEPLILNKF